MKTEKDVSVRASVDSQVNAGVIGAEVACLPTPGPWFQQGLVVAALSADRVVCVTNYSDKPVSEARANARLIAAAPDLLAALEQILSEAERAICSVHAIELCASDAIAKATGKA